MRSFITFAALASCILPIVAQTGTGKNCDIVEIVDVKPGQTLGQIAIDKSRSIPQLLYVNPDITDPNVIQVGQHVKIPNSACDPPPPPPQPKGAPIPCSPNPNKLDVYNVISGDTLFLIAGRIGVTLEVLEKYNRQITNPDFITIGQPITVPPCSEVKPPGQKLASCSSGTDPIYVVLAGEYLALIAETKLKITLESLIKANPQITDPNLIFPNQHLNVPLCDKTKTSADCSAPTATPHVGARDSRLRFARRNQVAGGVELKTK